MNHRTSRPLAMPLAAAACTLAWAALPAQLAAQATATPANAAKPAAVANKPATTAPAAKAAPAKPVAAKPTPTASRQALDNEAKGLALASQTAAQISAGQLDVAARVLTGVADCELRQQVNVASVEGKPGHFTVSFQGKHYNMLPEETATGAVRLEDKRAGIVWLQIPAKSMLMNAKLGQRMVDNCTQSEQRAALAAVQAAAANPAAAPASAPAESGGLGITAAPTPTR